MNTDFTNEEVQLAASKGATWMDEFHPDWVNEINLQKLEMNDCEKCVLGQAVGDFSAAITSAVGEKLARLKWATEHGFCAPNFDKEGIPNWATEDSYYVKLDAVWAEEVRKRL